VSDIKSLGYITVQTNDIDRWRTFAFDVLGFARGAGPDASALYLRMDERAARIVVVPGETDEVVTVGWEVRDRPALLRVQERLQSVGVGVTSLPHEDADARRVEEAITFSDPTGTTVEVFHGAVLDHTPVVTPFGARFITGAMGLGHVVLPATDAVATFDFYTNVLGFSRAAPGGYPLPHSTARCGSDSSASTNDTTAWRSFPPCATALPG
jgi:3,4-dihydroxy-9,10-secoandrosta-1,3,5(10)-triene-9,17-dione 4,5-dioxygenase